MLRNLADMRDDGNIQPMPSMTVEKKVLCGCELAVVIVQPSIAFPVCLRGRTWIRIGPRRAVATLEEEARLAEWRRARDIHFDIMPLSSATIHDLDLDLFKREYLPLAIAPEILEQNKRSIEDQLLALRFLDNNGQPTVRCNVTVVRK
ncbi:MAG: hypothetical protein ACUBOA_13960 [Candidatus Loosdrechtia sp.]|uniref:hypothetical protein n=1 Tax=Candidatus Loosdrechtia sp. TaxID=3101272 RepID=UPI003A6A378E|nr:MAG: hypothetical protein QY305_07855 [Candidatus Jettenia sp. AMX2]